MKNKAIKRDLSLVKPSTTTAIQASKSSPTAKESGGVSNKEIAPVPSSSRKLEILKELANNPYYENKVDFKGLIEVITL